MYLIEYWFRKYYRGIGLIYGNIFASIASIILFLYYLNQLYQTIHKVKWYPLNTINSFFLYKLTILYSIKIKYYPYLLIDFKYFLDSTA
jgi:hypothetical protein